MTENTLNPEFFTPVGRALLIGSFAYCLIQSMRGNFELPVAFERLAIGFLALLFFKAGGSMLLEISKDLSGAVHKMGHEEDVKTIILEALRNAAAEPTASGGRTVFNIPAAVEQVWRTGVWGLTASLVELAFMLADLVLECAREVFWRLLLVLFPIACGLFPVFPRMMSNLALYAVELALWIPFLSLIKIATGSVAGHYLLKSGSWGLYVIAIELLSIALILMIPSLTHRFLSGAFAGDFDSQSSLLKTARTAVFSAKHWVDKR